MLLQVLNQLQSAWQAFDLSQANISTDYWCLDDTDLCKEVVLSLLHLGRQFGMGQRDFRPFKKYPHCVWCWSAHQLRLEVPAHRLSIRFQDVIGSFGVNALRIDQQSV